MSAGISSGAAGMELDLSEGEFILDDASHTWDLVNKYGLNYINIQDRTGWGRARIRRMDRNNKVVVVKLRSTKKLGI